MSETTVFGSFAHRWSGRDRYDPPMATILAHITVRPGTEAEFEALARRLYAGTHATETAVRHYEYWRGSEPRTYYTLLSFDDHRGFIAHQTSEHHESASPELGRMIERLRLEWVDPVPGASALVPTRMQSAPPDADQLTLDYTDRFAAVIAEWWSTIDE
jgi:quinol monooxygenase YgiN